MVGVGLLILCLELVLHYGFDNDSLAWWSQVHGFLYLLYAVTTANLGLKAGWRLTRMGAVMAAGMVPIYSFVIERRVEARVRLDLAGEANPTADTVAS